MVNEQGDDTSFEEKEIADNGWGRYFCGGGCDTVLFFFPPDIQVCIDDDVPFYCSECVKDMMGSLN